MDESKKSLIFKNCENRYCKQNKFDRPFEFYFVCIFFLFFAKWCDMCAFSIFLLIFQINHNMYLLTTFDFEICDTVCNV